MDWIYLDNNATTRPADQVVDAMTEMTRDCWANPSSVHRFGQIARQRVELARGSVARLIGCRDRQIVFTSGGTESNNLALRGVLEARGSDSPRRVLITTPIEHSAIREPATAIEAMGVQLVRLPTDINGWVSPDDLATALDEHCPNANVVLVSIQWANNETGLIQPIEQLAEVIEQKRQTISQEQPNLILRFHSDATQVVGKIPVNLEAMKQAGHSIDLMTLSAHKFHGPKGIGALYVRTGVRLHSQHLGGPHENELRGGTENTPGIVGMGVAADLAGAFLNDPSLADNLSILRDRLEQQVCELLPDTVINAAGRAGMRIWNTSNMGFPRLESEAILLGLSERGVCASAGAACSSGSLEPSPVLLAMGIDETIAHGSVRFSLSRYTAGQQIDQAVAVIQEVVSRLSRTLPLGT